MSSRSPYVFSQSLCTSSFHSQENAPPVCWKPQAFWDQLNRGCAHPHSVGFPIQIGIKPIEKAKQTRLRQGSNQHGVCPEYLEGIKMQFIHGEKGNALITTFSDFSFSQSPLSVFSNGNGQHALTLEICLLQHLVGLFRESTKYLDVALLK